MKNLIVEGFGDKVFFEKYCVHHAFDVDVTVITLMCAEKTGGFNLVN